MKAWMWDLYWLVLKHGTSIEDAVVINHHIYDIVVALNDINIEEADKIGTVQEYIEHLNE